MPASLPSTSATQLFETIVCPLCESGEMDILRPSSHAASITAEDIRKLYSASSAHVLTDQVVRCRSCCLVYVNPRPIPELTISAYAAAIDPVFVAQNHYRISSFRKC